MADSVKTVQVAADTGGGTQEITVAGWGITPKAALFIMTLATADDTAAAHAALSYGFTDGARDRVISGFSEDAVATSVEKRGQDNDQCIQYMTDAGVLAQATGIGDGAGSNPGPIANGWRISWGTTPPAAYKITAIFFGSASMEVYCGNFAGDGVGVPDDVDVTAPGFEPDVVLTASVFLSATPAGPTSHCMCAVGVCHNDVSAINRSVSWSIKHNNATSAPYSKYSETYIGSAMYNGGQEVEILLKDFDANGFTGRFETNANGDNAIVNYLAIKFGEGEQVHLGTIDTKTSTGTQAYTDPGFTPFALLTIASYSDVVDTMESDGDAGSLGFGAATGAATEYSNSVQAEDAVGTMNTQSMADSVVMNLPQDDGTAGIVAELSSFGANGPTLNFTTADATARKWAALTVGAAPVGGTILPQIMAHEAG